MSELRTTWVVYEVARGVTWHIDLATENRARKLAAAWSERHRSPFDAETLESAQRRALDFKLGAASLVTSP